MVSGAAGSLGSWFSARGCGSSGSLHHSAQPAGLVTCQTDPAVSAGGPDQGGVLLHHRAGPPGRAAALLIFSTVGNTLLAHLFIFLFFRF